MHAMPESELPFELKAIREMTTAMLAAAEKHCWDGSTAHR